MQYDERIVDAACMHLVMHPEAIDVLLLPNLYGDIVSDLCAGLVGGLGVVPGGQSRRRRRRRLRSGARHRADIAGQDKANPTALLLSAVLMLHHLDEDDRAERIMKALWAALADGSARTRDLGGTATTTAVHRRDRRGSIKRDSVSGEEVFS